MLAENSQNRFVISWVYPIILLIANLKKSIRKVEMYRMLYSVQRWACLRRLHFTWVKQSLNWRIHTKRKGKVESERKKEEKKRRECARVREMAFLVDSQGVGLH